MLFKKQKSKQHLKFFKSNFLVLLNFFDSLVYNIIFFDYNEKILKRINDHDDKTRMIIQI
jgi:hypothetical protein